MALTKLTDDNFSQEVLSSDTPVLVDFWAEWCMPCHAVAPVVEEIEKEYAGKVKVGKFNVDENPRMAGQLGIMGLPTNLVFKGGQPVKSIVGAQGKDAFRKALDEVLAS